MRDPGQWRVRGPTTLGPPTVRSKSRARDRWHHELRPARHETSEQGADAAPTILVVGAVQHLESLQDIGHIQRAGWRVVAPCAARSPADLVVVGRPSAEVDAAAVIAGLKSDPATAAIPVLHVAPVEAGCARCPADACLSAGSTPGQMARVAHVLLELARARARSSGLYAARARLAAGAASRPAP